MDNNTTVLGMVACITLIILSALYAGIQTTNPECSFELDGTIEGNFIILNITTDNGMGHSILNKATGKIKVTAPCKYLDELNL